jgi:hypothetical protein
VGSARDEDETGYVGSMDGADDDVGYVGSAEAVDDATTEVEEGTAQSGLAVSVTQVVIAEATPEL